MTDALHCLIIILILFSLEETVHCSVASGQGATNLLLLVLLPLRPPLLTVSEFSAFADI
jgi:hypothetical protein